MTLLLGCVADDLTGATDLANALVRHGMRAVQIMEPEADLGGLDSAEAMVFALKTRTIPSEQAVDQSLKALSALRARGCRQFFFKYCSTFDSTDAGNIGPVTEALQDALGSGLAVACPAFPTNGRTVYNGHLFVGGVLLSDSPMRDHPLTPMTDANLVRVLGRQTTGEVGLIAYDVVDLGPQAIGAAIEDLRTRGVRHAIADALDDAHLHALGTANAGAILVTGGSGMAIGLPENFRRMGLMPDRRRPPVGIETGAKPSHGPAAVIAGSCSQATRRQVAHMAERAPHLKVDPLGLAQGPDAAQAALDWAKTRLADQPVLIYASAEPEEVARVQAALGVEGASTTVEQALAFIAKGLVDAGTRRLVVAGGETAGAVVHALGIKILEIGREIDPGVPWTRGFGAPRVELALKSGNFGSEDFFLKALKQPFDED
ncbi:MAG: 3-oxo-tetronate kinase [Kiloniellales bacterium]